MNRSAQMILLLLLSCVAAGRATPLKVFILAGQSNMDGHAKIATFDHIGMDPKTAPLLKEMRDTDGSSRVCDNAWISHFSGTKDGDPDVHGSLTSGYGARKNHARSDGKIGPEFTFGIYMQKHLNEPILIIKTAWGGKSLHTDFRPPSVDEEKAGGVYYRLMMNYVNRVLKDIGRVCPEYDAEQGYELAGFVWFQGWNDMVDGKVFPNRNQPGGYALYSELLARLIRDVRNELGAPRMHFVIGVMGVGGIIDESTPARVRASRQNFKAAMEAPSKLPEFIGNVTAVQTDQYWDPELGELASRWNKVRVKAKALGKDQTLDKQQRTGALNQFKAELFSPEEMALKEAGISNGDYHYLGSAKIVGQIGKAFAEAMCEGMRQ